MAEIDLTTDRHLASQTGNYELWLPKNNGPDESWGVLLNENFDLIDSKFAEVGESLSESLSKERILESAISTEHIRVNSALDRLDIKDSQVESLDERTTDLETEVDDARGDSDSIGTRLRLINDDDGTPRTDQYLANLKRRQMIMYEETLTGSSQSYVDIPDVFGTGKPEPSDGSDFGVICESANGLNYGLVFTPNKEPIYNEDGERVICRFVQNGDELRTNFENLTGTGFTFNSPSAYRSYPDIVIFYPQIVNPHDHDVNDEVRLYPEVVGIANTNEYGTVKLGHNNDNAADTVDGYHASGDRAANTLLPLDASKEFPSVAINLDNDGTPTTLYAQYPSFLYTRPGQTYKNIDDYIGAIGNEKFVGVSISGELGSVITDLGGQFTRTISTLENQVDAAVSGYLFNATEITRIETASVSGDQDLGELISQNTSDINDEIGRSTDVDLDHEDRVQILESGSTMHYSASPDAHHSSTSNLLDITPNKVTAALGDFDLLTVDTLFVEEETHINKEITIVDRFLDINAPSGETISGQFIPNAFGSKEVPYSDTNYGGGFVFHKGMTYASGEYALLRYNPNSESLEMSEEWSPVNIATSGEYHDANIFSAFGGAAPYTKIRTEADPNITGAIDSLPAGGGKVILREGEYTGDFVLPNKVTLEGMGYSTYINGTVTVSGERNILTKLRAKEVHLLSGATFNQVIHNYVDNGDLVNDAVSDDNLIWGNLE